MEPVQIPEEARDYVPQLGRKEGKGLHRGEKQKEIAQPVKIDAPQQLPVGRYWFPPTHTGDSYTSYYYSGDGSSYQEQGNASGFQQQEGSFAFQQQESHTSRGSSFELTHTSNSGEAQMGDVSPKERSKRTATVVCKVILGKNVFDLVVANQMVKGDVIKVAIVSITAAEQTSNPIPLCHNINLTDVQLDLRLNQEDFSVTR